MSTAAARGLLLSVSSVGIGLAVAVGAVGWWSPDPDLRGWSAIVGASFLIPVSASLSGWLLAQARREADRLRSLPASSGRWGGDDLPAPDSEAVVRYAAGWPQALAAAGPAMLALALLALIRPAGGGPTLELVPALIALALLFPLVVVERLVAESTIEALPDREALVRLLRVPSAVTAIAGLALLAASMGWPMAWYAQWPTAVLVGLIAAEMVGRALLHLWLPRAELRSCSDSLIAGVLLARLNPFIVVITGLRDRCGIDLAKSWSAQVVARAFPGVTLLLVVCGWLLTGVSVVPLGSRMVLEGGEVLRVMGAGTHVHAPWPFASRLSLDDGRIRETVLGDPESLMPALPAQATPSAAYDRLWDAAHPAEAVFVVAARSAAGAGQGFRVVAGDVRVQWRIGGSDADAIALVGHLTEPEVLVARTARRALATTFAQKSMEALMAEDRDQIGSFLRARIQADLDRLAGGSGLEVMAVIVDALHPPVGAAAAYHRVQSAEIEARAAVARSRGEASRKTSVAEVDAVHRVAAAQATAYETSAKARGDALRFAADHRAWAANREAMATERWLDAVRDGLIGKPVLVLDHRLDLGEVPVLDLRSSTPERRP